MLTGNVDRLAECDIFSGTAENYTRCPQLEGQVGYILGAFQGTDSLSHLFLRDLIQIGCLELHCNVY